MENLVPETCRSLIVAITIAINMTHPEFILSGESCFLCGTIFPAPTPALPRLTANLA